MSPAHPFNPCPPPPPLAAGLQIEFGTDTSLEEVRQTLELSRIAVETLYGPAVFALDADYRLDHDKRSVWIDTNNAVGRTLALVFLGYVRQEFDGARIQVCRVGIPTAAGHGEVHS